MTKPKIQLALSLAAVALCATLPIARPLAAHQYPLSSTAIREAYFLGKDSAAEREEFFARYTHQLPMPKTGPRVAQIRMETPFAVVVERVASKGLASYHAMDAEKEFLGKPAIFRLRVRIDLTSTYPAQSASEAGLHLRREDFWRDFPIRLLQSAKIEPRSVRGQPIYSIASDLGGSVLLGAEVVLEYDAAKIQSAPVTIEVDTPDGQLVRAEFDIGKLR